MRSCGWWMVGRDTQRGVRIRNAVSVDRRCMADAPSPIGRAIARPYASVPNNESFDHFAGLFST
jgi:hypothetical protein